MDSTELDTRLLGLHPSKPRRPAATTQKLVEEMRLGPRPTSRTRWQPQVGAELLGESDVTGNKRHGSVPFGAAGDIACRSDGNLLARVEQLDECVGKLNFHLSELVSERPNLSDASALQLEARVGKIEPRLGALESLLERLEPFIVWLVPHVHRFELQASVPADLESRTRVLEKRVAKLAFPPDENGAVACGEKHSSSQSKFADAGESPTMSDCEMDVQREDLWDRTRTSVELEKGSRKSSFLDARFQTQQGSLKVTTEIGSDARRQCAVRLLDGLSERLDEALSEISFRLDSLADNTTSAVRELLMETARLESQNVERGSKLQHLDEREAAHYELTHEVLSGLQTSLGQSVQADRVFKQLEQRVLQCEGRSDAQQRRADAAHRVLTDGLRGLEDTMESISDRIVGVEGQIDEVLYKTLRDEVARALAEQPEPSHLCRLRAIEERMTEVLSVLSLSRSHEGPFHSTGRGPFSRSARHGLASRRAESVCAQRRPSTF